MNYACYYFTQECTVTDHRNTLLWWLTTVVNQGLLTDHQERSGHIICIVAQLVQDR